MSVAFARIYYSVPPPVPTPNTNRGCYLFPGPDQERIPRLPHEHPKQQNFQDEDKWFSE